MIRDILNPAQSSSLRAGRNASSLCPIEEIVPVASAGEPDDVLLRVALPLFRFIGAAYTTGVSDCWEAAYRLADDVAGISEGPILVARVATLVRIFRGGGSSDAVYLPPCCIRLSKHEAQLIELLRAARDGGPNALRLTRVRQPGEVNLGREGVVVQAGAALSELLFGTCLAARSARVADLALRESSVPSHTAGFF